MNPPTFLFSLVAAASLACAAPQQPLQVWLFGSAEGRDGDGEMLLQNTSSTNGEWTIEEKTLRFLNPFLQDPDDENFSEAMATIDLSAFGYRPGDNFTLWLRLDISGVWEWNRFGIVAFGGAPDGHQSVGKGFTSARLQVLKRGMAEIALANDFRGREGERSQRMLPERLTDDRYRLILTGEHQPEGGLRLTFSAQRGDDDTPYVLTDLLPTVPTGTYFGFGGRFRSHQGKQPIVDLVEMRYEARHSSVAAPLSDPIQKIGIWQNDGHTYRYRATLRRAAHRDDALPTTVVLSRGTEGQDDSQKKEALLDSGQLVVELNTAGVIGDSDTIAGILTNFSRDLPSLLPEHSDGVLRTDSESIQLPMGISVPARATPVPEESVDAVRVRRKAGPPTPSVLAYNLGHFSKESNAHDWWAYSGATGARAFVSPLHFEGRSERPPGDSEVGGRDDFLAMRERLTANPEDKRLIDWEWFRDRKAKVPLDGANRIHVDHALGHLATLSPDVLIQASMVPEIFLIVNDDDWTGKWRLWRSFFSMVYSYASKYGIERFAMHNEPNHPLMLIEPEQWLMRAALCSDAAERAIDAVNREQGTNLKAQLFVPVTAGDIGDPFTGPYELYGRPILERWDLNFLGQRTGEPLYANYAVQRYNATPENFGRGLLELKKKVAEDLPWNMPMPGFSITEFNVHHGRFFDTIEESMDTPSKFLHLAGILTHLTRAGLQEFYVFKFGLTKAMPGRQFLVHKNGMFYCDNEQAPHNYGGPTRGAEVYRLFIQAHAPERNQLLIETPEDNSLDISGSHDPASNDMWLFSVNSENQPQKLDIDLTEWAADREVIVSEVSAGKAGEVVAQASIPAGGRLQLIQPGESVWLVHLPPLDPQVRWQEVMATTSAEVSDVASERIATGAPDLIKVSNPANASQPRSVAVYSFELPEFEAGQLRAAVLTLAGQPDGTGDQPVQAQVFVVDLADWSAESISWSNTHALLPDVPRGHFISNRVVDQASGAARVVGQINLSELKMQNLQLDLTGALRDSGGKNITILVAQEPRWDVHPSDRKANGDIQQHGLELAPAGAPAPNTPRINMLMGRD